LTKKDQAIYDNKIQAATEASENFREKARKYNTLSGKTEEKKEALEEKKVAEENRFEKIAALNKFIATRKSPDIPPSMFQRMKTQASKMVDFFEPGSSVQPRTTPKTRQHSSRGGKSIRNGVQKRKSFALNNTRKYRQQFTCINGAYPEK
jgi:hypothetical protein